jgi:Fe-S-cluster containining protein
VSKPTAIVPCGSCTLCCGREAIVLHPEDGDDVDSYETQVIPHPLKPNQLVHILKHNGDRCIYLGPFGCSIWARRPMICREFDCRGFAKRFTRHQMNKMVKAGVADMEVWERGRELLKREKQDV